MTLIETALSPIPEGDDGAISSDLAELAHLHVSFLRRLHGLGVTFAQPAHESLRRYVELWLPLLAKASSTEKEIIPPADIAWLWHCHRLASAKYEEYIRKQFGFDAMALTQLNGAKASFQFLVQESPPHHKDYSIKFWNQHCPNEQFIVWDPSKEAVENSSKPLFASALKALKGDFGQSKSKASRFDLCGFDLMGCAKRQATFLWNISGTEFHQPNSMALDPAFLAQSVDNYERFLLLQLQVGHVLAPTYAIDLIWHTHILASTQQYNEDCIRLLGKKFHHDDSIKVEILDDAFAKTCKLWNEVYWSDLKSFGGLNRGEPPKDFYDSKWRNIANEDTRAAEFVSISINDDGRSDEETSTEEKPYNRDVVLFAIGFLSVTIATVVTLCLAFDLHKTENFLFFAGIAFLICLAGLFRAITPEHLRSNGGNRGGGCSGGGCGGGCGGGDGGGCGGD